MSLWLIFLINIYILYSLQIFHLEACLIFQNKMAATVISKNFYTFLGPRGKGLMLKDRMATLGVCSMVIKEYCTF